MKIHAIMLIALAAAIPSASVAGAESRATKQRVAINARNLSSGQFVFEPLAVGQLRRDAGSARIVWTKTGHAMRQGQSLSLYDTTFTYKGKRGTLTVRERIEWVDVSNDKAPGADFRPGVAFGVWEVVGGTGQYARIAGGGRTAHAGMGLEWFARQEGFVTRR